MMLECRHLPKRGSSASPSRVPASKTFAANFTIACHLERPLRPKLLLHLVETSVLHISKSASTTSPGLRHHAKKDGVVDPGGGECGEPSQLHPRAHPAPGKRSTLPGACSARDLLHPSFLCTAIESKWLRTGGCGAGNAVRGTGTKLAARPRLKAAPQLLLRMRADDQDNTEKPNVMAVIRWSYPAFREHTGGCAWRPHAE